VVEHGGAFIGFRAALTRFPEQRLSVAVLCNDYSVNPDGFVHAVADRYLAGQFPAPAASVAARLAPDRLARIGGRYAVMPGGVLSLEVRGDSVMASAPGLPPTRLPAVSDSSVRADLLGVNLVFPATPPGLPPALVMVSRNGEDRVARLGEPPVLTAPAREALVGEYWSDELEVRAHLTVSGDTLRLAVGATPAAPLEPLAPDAFTLPGMQLDVTRTRRGAITGFTLSAGRSQGVVFRRVAAVP
jgi:hypothetical protein